MKTQIHRLIFVAIITLTLSYNASAEEIQLTWDANQEKDLAGYRLYRYIGTPDDTEGQYEHRVKWFKQIEPLSEPVYVDQDIVIDGKYFYRVSAFDTYDNESGLSNEAFEIIDREAPEPPKTLRSILQKMIAFFRKLLPWNKSLRVS